MDPMTALASVIGCCRGCCGKACEKCMELKLKTHELTFNDVGRPPNSYPGSYELDESVWCRPSVAESSLTLKDNDVLSHIPLGVRMLQDEGGRLEGPTSWTLVTTARDASAPHPESSSCAAQCPICRDQVDLDTAVTFRCKQHPVCHECCTNYFKAQLNQGKLPTCMADGCGAEACPRLAELMLDGEEIDKYLPIALRAAKRLHNCPKCNQLVYKAESLVPKCGNTFAAENGNGSTGSSSSSERGQQQGESQLWQEEEAQKPVEPPKSKVGLDSAVRCPDCHHEFCTKCRQSAHFGLFCDEARLKSGKEEVLSLSLVDMNIRKCPSCDSPCIKNSEEECDHVICKVCMFEFCWICRADRKVIYAHGNHYHLRTCRHYNNYEEESYLPHHCSKCLERGSACIPVDKPPKKKLR